LSFVDRVKTALTKNGVNAGTLTEERVSAILKEFYDRIDQQLSKMDSTINGTVPHNVVQERVETCQGYKLHFLKVVSIKFPATGVFLDVMLMICGDNGG
jgi:hypothetical protein